MKSVVKLVLYICLETDSKFMKNYCKINCIPYGRHHLVAAGTEFPMLGTKIPCVGDWYPMLGTNASITNQIMARTVDLSGTAE